MARADRCGTSTARPMHAWDPFGEKWEEREGVRPRGREPRDRSTGYSVGGFSISRMRLLISSMRAFRASASDLRASISLTGSPSWG